MTGTIDTKKITSAASESAVRLKIMLKPLWRALTFSPADDVISYKKNLCVSIDRTGTSVAYGSRFLSSVRVKEFKKYPQAEHGYPLPEDLATSAALAISELGASRTGITLSIPKAWTVIRAVELPSTVKDNISNVISYELDRLTPFSAEDAFYDFRIISEHKEKLNVLIMATKTDLINPYITALEGKGITVNALTVNLSCICSLLNYIDKSADSLFIEINENGYEGALFLDGIIKNVFTSSFEKEDEKSRADMIINETEPLMDILRKEGKSSKITVLPNTDNKSSALKELLKLRINMPVRILSETDIKLMPSGEHKGASYAAIGGVLESLWPKAKGLNLFTKGLHERGKTPISLTIILILTIIAVWGLYIIAPLQIEEKRLKEIESRLTSMKEDVRKTEALKKEIDALSNENSTIETFKINRQMTLNIVKELTSILPRNAWLTRVRVTETAVEIEGFAASATELLPKIEASMYFKKAGFSSPTYFDARMKADKFIMKAEIENVMQDEVKKPEDEKK